MKTEDPNRTKGDFFLDTTLKELLEKGFISTRTFNGLFNNANFLTLGDVFYNIDTPSDLLNIRNFGRKSLMEMEAIFQQMEQIYKIPVSKKKTEVLPFLGEDITEIIKQAYASVTKGETKAAVYLRRTFPNPQYLHNFIMGGAEELLVAVGSFSREENLETRQLIKTYVDLVLEGLQQNRSSGNAFFEEYKNKSSFLAERMDYFTYEQIAQNLISAKAKGFLEKKYQAMVRSELSIRSKHFVEKELPHFTDLIKYADEPLAAYQNICPTRMMRKTLYDLFQFNKKLKIVFDKVSVMSDTELEMEVIKLDYPFLDSKQRSFVLDYMKTHGHLPLFFMMYHSLRLSEMRSDKVFCLLNGFFDGNKRTLAEVGEILNLSSERIRQIAYRSSPSVESFLEQKDGWNYYTTLFNRTYLYENSDEFFRLREDEHLFIDFSVFAALMMLVTDFTKKEIGNHTILLKKGQAGKALSGCLDKVKSIADARYAKDTYIPIDAIIGSLSNTKGLKELVFFVATKIYGLSVTEEGQLYLPQNYVDVAEELYVILAKKGVPMHVDDIYKAFKNKYPDSKYTTPLQIKGFLYKHSHIRSVGKTSCYALDSWEDIYFGSIRDLLFDLLSASDVPLHIDTLFEGVTKHYPNTTKASISSTMQNENLQRFVEFEGNFFGLSSKEYPEDYLEVTNQRYSFEERLKMFRDFVENYHRFPYLYDSELESSLTRWFFRATRGLVQMSEEQKTMLDNLTREYDSLGYPRTATEYEFLLNCQKVKDYIQQFHSLPTSRKAPELYGWLNRSRENYDSYTDKRRLFMTDLFNYILSFGFSI